MQAFVYDEVNRIEFDDGEWVDIKQRLSYGDVDSLLAGDSQALTEGKTSIPLLLTCITGWSFRDKDGEIAPIREDTVRQLDIRIASRLMREIQKRLPLA
jgi:hypothetical protein